MEYNLKPVHSADCPWHTDWHQCHCGLFNTLIYFEPGEDGSIITHRLTVEEAITRQFKHAKAMNYTYLSQEEALQDFIAVHWASFQKI